MTLCEHGKYEGHCSECIENIPAEPVYTDPRIMGVDMADKDDVTVYKYQTHEPLYTIETVIKMVMECKGLEIYSHDTFPHFLESPEAVIKLITEKGE